MASTQPMVLRWGIISTGGIATQFSKDLLIDPKTRHVYDIIHKITAVGSRTVSKAQEFINSLAGFGDTSSIMAYGSYEEVYLDDEVDVIYIGTPHTYHYGDSLQAITSKKHILCEKPVTSNLAELQSLIEAARENKVFFMEAMWTRFQPLSREFKKIAEGDEWNLGLPISVHADLAGDFGIENLPKTHRILDPDLGGGALLDLGPYPLVWAIMALYEHPAFASANTGTNPIGTNVSVTGSMLKTPLTGVDCLTSFVLNFTSSNFGASGGAQATLSCSINTESLDPGVTIRYERGLVRVPSPIFVPKSFNIVLYDKDKEVVREETKEFEYIGRGMHYQADEVARCIREGRLESKLWGHEKSLFEMWVFDKVRKQGGYEFPPGVEKVV